MKKKSLILFYLLISIVVYQNLSAQVRSVKIMEQGRVINRWAILIGISDYKFDTAMLGSSKGIQDLEGASKDARDYYRFLVEAQNVPEERIAAGAP